MVANEYRVTVEYRLIETYAAGTAYVRNKGPFFDLRLDDVLLLIREPHNPYDENAIMVTDRLGRKLGYVPRKDNKVLAALLDGGKLLAGRVTGLMLKGSAPDLHFEICMIE